MSEFNDFVGEVTARLARGLGLKPSDREQFLKWRTKFEEDKASNLDRWEQIKDDIRAVEFRLKKHKTEYEASHGKVKEMIGRQIEQGFRELDRKSGQITIVERNLESLTTFIDRLAELEHAKAVGVTEDAADKLAVQLEEGFAQVKDADGALKGLAGVQYEGPEKAPLDVDQRLSELDEAKPSTPGLSQSTAERLKRLEKEMEG
jgi:hypothetical protein